MSRIVEEIKPMIACSSEQEVKNHNTILVWLLILNNAAINALHVGARHEDIAKVAG